MVSTRMPGLCAHLIHLTHSSPNPNSRMAASSRSSNGKAHHIGRPSVTQVVLKWSLGNSSMKLTFWRSRVSQIGLWRCSTRRCFWRTNFSKNHNDPRAFSLVMKVADSSSGMGRRSHLVWPVGIRQLRLRLRSQPTHHLAGLVQLFLGEASGDLVPNHRPFEVGVVFKGGADG